MIYLEYGDHRPIYEQIKEKIISLITSGALKENDRIPSVRELAGTLAINPNTIQKAYRDLENDGYIYSVRAKGSFVAPFNEAVRKNDIDKMIDQMRTLISKIKYLGASYSDIEQLIQEEFSKGGKDND